MPSGIRILTDNGIVAGSLTAIVLNVFFNAARKRESHIVFEEQKAS
jgi:xanthine permease